MLNMITLKTQITQNHSHKKSQNSYSIGPKKTVYNNFKVLKSLKQGSMNFEQFVATCYVICMESCYWVVQCLDPLSKLNSLQLPLVWVDGYFGPITNKSDDVKAKSEKSESDDIMSGHVQFKQHIPTHPPPHIFSIMLQFTWKWG